MEVSHVLRLWTKLKESDFQEDTQEPPVSPVQRG